MRNGVEIQEVVQSNNSNLGESLAAKLKSQARSSGTNMQYLSTIFGLQGVLRRLGMSRYKDNFCLKGAMLLAVENGGLYQRQTNDVDFSIDLKVPDADALRSVLIEILKTDADDGLQFETDTASFKKERTHAGLPGGKLNVWAYLGSIKMRLSVDVQVGETYHVGMPPFRAVPSLFPDIIEQPVVRMLPLPYVLSEKLRAAVMFGSDNTRFRDYYDIATWIEHVEDANELAEALATTFAAREVSITDIDDVVALSDSFALEHEEDYRRLLERAGVANNKSFVDTCAWIRACVGPALKLAQCKVEAKETGLQGKIEEKPMDKPLLLH
ncbi:Nucleotidyl transferase AbiEii toxin, Type IV TA system [Thalassospira xiamenensis]|uniref:Nucleotidyl transferase AbiEii toxin, Type IV TA system n=2 Tax=Thalassospira xiamenensis TaxID=220697 RepID=A0A285TYA8_9PROT|nr:Nucleotidyl transferase AbiEii toxin, Type IV TA system [Thalassospira xiamenensis]